MGRDVQMFHRSDIKADLADLNKLEPNGAAKPRISIYNESLAKQLKEEYDIMCSAYDYMCENGLDFTTEVFERDSSYQKSCNGRT